MNQELRVRKARSDYDVTDHLQEIEEDVDEFFVYCVFFLRFLCIVYFFKSVLILRIRVGGCRNNNLNYLD